MNFFARGFPYVTSLYLGPVALGLAIAGLSGCGSGMPRRRLALLAVLGLLASLGEFGGLGFLVDAVPALHAFRYPVKAFFSFHLAVALLAARGLDAVQRGRCAGPALLQASFALPLVLAPLLPLVWPGQLGWFFSGFLPPDFSPQARGEVALRVLGDAAVGGAIALAAALVAGLAAASRLAPPRAAAALASLLAVDLVRAGAGLNPMAPPGFFQLSPEMHLVAARLHASGERIYTLDLSGSPAYRAGRVARGRDHERWTFTLFRETLSPLYNVAERVPSAWSPDLTMLAASERVLPPESVPPEHFAELVPALLRSGVGHVLSLDPLHDEHLTLEQLVASPRTAPLAVHLYRLRDPLPLFAVAREVVAARTRGEAARGAPYLRSPPWSRPTSRWAGPRAARGCCRSAVTPCCSRWRPARPPWPWCGRAGPRAGRPPWTGRLRRSGAQTGATARSRCLPGDPGWRCAIGHRGCCRGWPSPASAPCWWRAAG
jgi:hypothetical protein